MCATWRRSTCTRCSAARSAPCSCARWRSSRRTSAQAAGIKIGLIGRMGQTTAHFALQLHVLPLQPAHLYIIGRTNIGFTAQTAAHFAPQQ